MGAITFDDVWGEPIYTYTAEEAIADGILIDVTELAKEAGFKWPVRITRTVHDLATPPEDGHEDYTGRLWDILFLARMAIREADDPHFVTYKVGIGGEEYELWIALDTTDGYPALHIMRPEDY